MKVIVLLKHKLESLPAVMAVTDMIRALGCDVDVITSHSEEQTKRTFAENGVKTIDVMPDGEKVRSHVVSKARMWTTFSRRAWHCINDNRGEVLLWISSADTALALGKRLWGRRYILQIRELYDEHPLYRRCLAHYARKAACVVVPEMCRAAIFRSWYRLRETPVVLPNKPASHPCQTGLDIDDQASRDIFSKFAPNTKVVLYQGHIYSDRDIRPVAAAVNDLGDSWRFVAMGPAHSDYLEALKRTSPRVVHIPPVKAPRHLQVTSRAHIGIVTYSHKKLNNIFCAPNKIWEYAGFGLPMLCNNLPPLRMSVMTNGAGICIDHWESKSIERALKQMDSQYQSYSQASRRLYDSVDALSIIKGILAAADW